MDYTFTMEPLVGIVARSVDGPITSWMFGEDVWQLFREPQPPSQSEWMRHRIRWRADNSDAVVMLGLPTPQAVRDVLDQEGRIELTYFVSGVGWQSGAVTLRRIAEIDSPDLLRSRGAFGREPCTATFALHAPNTSPILDGEIRIKTASPLGYGYASFKVPLGRPVSLPSGEYDVIPVYGLRVTEDSQQFRVSPESTEIHVSLDRSVRYVGIEVLLPDGQPPSGALVTLYSAAGGRTSAVYGTRVHTWVPEGPLDVSVRAGGTSTWERLIPESDVSDVITARLEWDS